MQQPALFEAYPDLRENIPWIPILPKPTPTRRLAKLQEGLNTSEEIWVKLDNLTSEVYGGNKVRKLEFLLAHALKQNKHQIATLGGLGTNHGLATTVHGQANNLRTRLYLTEQPITPHVLQNLKLLYHFGADMIYAKTRRNAHFRFRYLDRLHQRHTYWLPLGGSSAVGVLGYVNAMFELHHQITSGQLPKPQFIFIPVGSLGTIAGIDLGLQLTGLSTRVKGICVSPHPSDPKKLTSLIQNTLKLLQSSGEFQAFTYHPQFELTTDHAGSGYGEPTTEGIEAIKLAREQEALTLDSTYTAKTLAGVISYIRMGGKGPILYWHTFNSVDLSPLANKVDYRHLPSPFHQFFKSAQL
ncbi:MAG: 1-aminocyclopropane-1-carboxylate deaminase/D-cysteine desulfhydrase [Candidatus Hermodarchaeia archaeon]|jgi:D-cysteine desulfhydrase